MDDDEYYRFIESIDLMLIPYTREHYHSQTSGIFAEAMGYGQVVVVSRGTWMSRQLQEYGGGGRLYSGRPNRLHQTGASASFAIATPIESRQPSAPGSG